MKVRKWIPVVDFKPPGLKDSGALNGQVVSVRSRRVLESGQEKEGESDLEEGESSGEDQAGTKSDQKDFPESVGTKISEKIGDSTAIERVLRRESRIAFLRDSVSCLWIIPSWKVQTFLGEPS